MSWYVFTIDELYELEDGITERLVEKGEFTEHETLLVEPSGMDNLKLDHEPVTIFEKPEGEMLKP